MGLVLFVITILADLLNLFISYLYGTWVLGHGILTGGNGWTATLHGVPSTLHHLSPAWRSWFLHATDSTWGWIQVGANLFLQVVASTVALRLRWKKLNGLKKFHPGDDEWERVERCYQQFIRAAQTQSPPLRIRHPRSWRFKPKGWDIEWVGHSLVIGDHLLGPNNRHLAPLLAHQLAYYNSHDLLFRRLLNCFPDRLLAIGIFVGMPIGLPALLRDFCWPLYWHRRVYAADLFACQLGQCNALIKTLEVRKAREKRHKAFSPEPYLAQRINRLKRWQRNPQPASPHLTSIP